MEADETSKLAQEGATSPVVKQMSRSTTGLCLMMKLEQGWEMRAGIPVYCFTIPVSES